MKLSPSIPRRTLALAALVICLAAMPGAQSVLSYDREGILTGELWRPMTAHLVHGNLYHLGWNLAALIALGFLFEGELKRGFHSLMLFSAISVSLGLLLFEPDLYLYAGLSGMLNGLWVGGALIAARTELAEGNRLLARLLQFGVLAGLAKIYIEAWTGIPVFTDAAALGGIPVPIAHALGALGGVSWLALQTRVLAPVSHRLLSNPV